MNHRTAIFISIEGLGTNLVGAYGNSVAPTPRIDSIAATSVVLDQLWNDSIKPEEVLRAWWSSKHQLESAESGPCYTPWLESIGQALLVTDCEVIAQCEASELVRQVVLVQRSVDEEWSPQEPEDEANRLLDFEHLLQVALGTWHSVKDEHPILWIHSKGLNGTWDAPYELREMLCDEEDPPPVTSTQPVELQITTKTDPDEVFQIVCAVGGQVISIDQAIGDCFDTLCEIEGSENCLFSIIGMDGYPLGEHGKVGGSGTDLYSERLHVPCIMRFGSTLPLGIRLSILLQPHQIGSLLNAWFSPSLDTNSLYEQHLAAFSPEIDGESPIGTAIAKNEDSIFVGAPAWSFHVHGFGHPNHRTQLFAKPDDRWEQNDVSSRAPIVLEKMDILCRKLTAYYQAAPQDRCAINWLDSELTQLHR